jgi:hypothetical protein
MISHAAIMEQLAILEENATALAKTLKKHIMFQLNKVH